jgi:DNA-binding IclR family transcriptional regulator
MLIGIGGVHPEGRRGMAAAVRQLEEIVARNEVPADSVIEKVRCLIETLAAHGPLGLTALARESGIAKTTVHRLCSELLEWGILERSAGGFTLGRRLAELGHMAPNSGSLAQVGHPYMAELFATFRLATNLSVLHDKASIRCVDKIWVVGQDPANYWMGIGTRAPAYCTAAGKAIVAFSPPDVFAAVVAQPLVALTPYTARGPEGFAREIEEVRRTGVAWTRNEVRMNTVGVAVPIVTDYGKVLGALSCGLGGRATRTDELIKAMKVQARRIAQQMQ